MYSAHDELDPLGRHPNISNIFRVQAGMPNRLWTGPTEGADERGFRPALNVSLIKLAQCVGRASARASVGQAAPGETARAMRFSSWPEMRARSRSVP